MQHKILNIIGIIAVVIAMVAAYFITGTKGKIMNIGIKMENMDTSVRAGDNFFDYATLGWRRANPIPDDYTRYGAFEVLNDVNLERVREIAENDNGKIGTLYKLAMNAEKLNADGVAPVKNYLNEIDKIKSKDELPTYLGKMHTFTSAFWADSVALDEKNSDIVRSIIFNDAEKLIKFIQTIQKYSPVDSFAIPFPWDMPGYNDQVIMAAGTFVAGSSIELSCDGPIRPPYIAYFQGGLTYEHVKMVAEKLIDEV